MIEMQQLQRLDIEQVINLLLEQKKQPLEIYIPKQTQLFFNENEAISMDYARLAYAGQLLKDISSEFQYEKITPDLHESICFRIKINELESLAMVLLEISYGYGNTNTDDEEFEFDQEAEEYVLNVENGEFTKIACPYFIEIYKQYKNFTID